MSYRISTPRPEFVARARAEGKDDQDQPVRRLVAEGGEPLRDLLRRARPGEAILLGSYCGFTQPGPFREYGPIYVSAAASEAAPGSIAAIVDRGYFPSPFVLRAYAADGDIARAEIVAPDQAEARLAVLLDGAAFVDARFAAFGCWAARFSAADRP